MRVSAGVEEAGALWEGLQGWRGLELQASSRLIFGELGAESPCGSLLCGNEPRLLVSSCLHQAMFVTLFIPHLSPRYPPPTQLSKFWQVRSQNSRTV